MLDDFLWVERYRPRVVKDLILPDDVKSQFQEFVDTKNVPNLILSGIQGSGKTSSARAMLEELGCDYIIINGSDEGRLIDTLRTKIKNFATAVSFSGGRKYVILDEADAMGADTIQPALRNFMEEYSKNCGFILTCNFLNKIIKPLHSRCSVIEYKIPNKLKPILAKQMFDRVIGILDDNSIHYDKKAVAEVVTKHFPDNRRIINELQRYSATGLIDTGILVNLNDESFGELVTLLKNKKFNEVRKWVAQNAEGDSSYLFRKIYDTISTYAKPQSIPQVVITLADYQTKAAFAADQEINLMAMLTEMMIDVEWIE